MANSDMFDTQWVPQLGVAVNAGRGYTVKGNIAMGYRNPSFRELYLYRMANESLQPEKMMNYEISAGKQFSRFLSAEVTVYYSRGRDMVQTVDNRNVNTGRFINKGIEITATSRPLDNLRLYATYSYLHTSLSNLTGAPKNQYYLGGELTTLRERLKIAADLKGTGSLYVADDVKHQSYALLNLKLTYKVCSYADIFTRLENITDARYTINRGYEMPGFTAMGGIKSQFLNENTAEARRECGRDLSEMLHIHFLTDCVALFYFGIFAIIMKPSRHETQCRNKTAIHSSDIHIFSRAAAGSRSLAAA